VGTAVTNSGTITVSPAANMVQNFTTSGKTSTFYTISGNMNSTAGNVSYNGLNLTACLKMESATSITFTATQAGSLIMVFDATFVKTVKVDGVAYTAVAGVVTVNISAGLHTITKGDTTNLYYISLSYITGISNSIVTNVSLYPNPVMNSLFISLDALVQKVEIYSLTGMLMLQKVGNSKTIDMSGLSSGSYLVEVFSNQAVIKQLIIKK
ncbi:MAG: T9SS type A sorting domain-containing protein, partial [Paludibacter sp.]